MTTGTVQDKGAQAFGIKRFELPPACGEQIEDNRGVISECLCGDAPVSEHPVLKVDQERGECRHRSGGGCGGKTLSLHKGEKVLCPERADRRVAGTRCSSFFALTDFARHEPKQ